MRRGQTAPRTVTRGLRERAWWCMRRWGAFTLPELLSTVANGSERSADSNLRKYLRALACAGILVVDEQRVGIVKGSTSNGLLRYRLVVNRGRRAPVWRAASRQVFDPNTGEVRDVQ